MIQTRVIFIALLLMTIAARSEAAFQCYKCNNCGSSWDANRAYMTFTEGGGNYCTKQVVGTQVIKDYSPTCKAGNGLSCCQSDLCNSSNSKYYFNFGLLATVLTAALMAKRY